MLSFLNFLPSFPHKQVSILTWVVRHTQTNVILVGPHTWKGLVALHEQLKLLNISANPHKGICNLKNRLVSELFAQSLERAVESLKHVLFFSREAIFNQRYSPLPFFASNATADFQSDLEVQPMTIFNVIGFWVQLTECYGDILVAPDHVFSVAELR